MQYYIPMKKAPRFPSRWAGRSQTLAITAMLSAALGACSSMDNVLYGAREGTVEYPGSGATAGAVPSYVVKYKDTVDSVAQRFGVSSQTIIERNKLQPPYALQPGRTIEIPGARVIAPSSSESVETAAAAPSRGPVQRETLAPPPGATSASTSGQTQSEPPRSAAPSPAATGEPTPLGPAAAAPPPSGPAPRFEWPIRGKVIAGYGTHDGQKNDGIDIQAEKGATVHAADSGTVVYAGNEVRGMGNLLLVSHSGGYITAYGYNDSLLVKKGDTVKKGQAIAKVGTSGTAPDPRLHFEVRRGNKTLDPATVLPGQ